MTTLHALDPEPVGLTVVATLEEVLALARDGGLSSVSIAIVHRDGRASAAWSDLPSRMAALGAIARLTHKINLEADEA